MNVYASARIYLLGIPRSGDRLILGTPDGASHVFEYDCLGTSIAEFSIQIRPAPYGGDSLSIVVAKTVSAILQSGLFGSCSYDEANQCIWVVQNISGPEGNTSNSTTANSSVLRVTNFAGGHRDEQSAADCEKNGTGSGTPSDAARQQTLVNNLQRDLTSRRAARAKELSEDKKRINRKKNAAKKCSTPRSRSSFRRLPAGSSGLREQRKIPCPTCNASNRVKDKIAGRNYFQIPFTDFRIPRTDHLVDAIPTFDENRRDGGTCGACGGSKQITDVTDDTAKYERAADKIKEKTDKILEREAKLGLGGTRTTIIQGSDLLFVGLGFNSNKTYEVMPGGSIAPTLNGGKIPQQNSVPVNAVVGKQGSMAWPQQVGNYTIKCANKFSLLAGAGGITIATPGPLTFSSGMMKFTGPQITIGCASGPLVLEGDSVNISGKAISITPTGGEFFIKGNISNTGNITTQGHAHFESMSFAKASCVGVNKSTLQATANPDVSNTQRATWGRAAVAAALLDLQSLFQAVPMDSESSSYRLLSPKETKNISDRLRSISKLALPWEREVTGYILPGTRFTALINGLPAVVVLTSLCDVHNIPHMHGIPEMKHTHEVNLPDMDYTNDSTQALRDKVLTGAHESGLPSDPTKDTVTRMDEVSRTAVEYQAASVVNGTKNAAASVRLS